MKKLTLGIMTAAALLAGAAAAPAATLQDVENSFYPYKNWTPQHPFVKPGITINQANVEKAKDVLDPAMYQHIKDGWIELEVGDTVDLHLNSNYVEATRKGIGKVKLGAKLGELDGYTAGRAFPEEPRLDDPRAGEKLSWNYKYGYNWGDNAAIYPFYWTYRDMKSGKVERTIKFNFHFLNFMHRVDYDPKPELPNNPSRVFRGIYVKVLEPFDLKNTQLLILRYENDLKRDNAWLYLGFQRRVRRLATGQVTDSFLGTDLMIEDFEGYNGRISDMKWVYKGTATMLAPFYYHNDMPLDNTLNEPDGFQFLKYGGKGNCFPEFTYQLRKTYIYEGIPTDKNHPISKRILYMDSQTAKLWQTVIYDRKGELWKSFIDGAANADHHLPINKGRGAPLDDSVTMMDIQAQHCTTLQFKVSITPEGNQPSLFTVQNMRATGR
jgi:hypothetical protein